MGTVFQHLPKISEETIYSITLFKRSNKIITMQASMFCCVLFFIGYVNGSPYWNWSELEDAKRSDDASAERMDLAADRWDWNGLGKRMDSEMNVWMPRMDVEAKVKRVLNELKGKLADGAVLDVVLFKPKHHHRHAHDKQGQEGLTTTDNSSAGEAELPANHLPEEARFYSAL